MSDDSRTTFRSVLFCDDFETAEIGAAWQLREEGGEVAVRSPTDGQNWVRFETKQDGDVAGIRSADLDLTEHSSLRIAADFSVEDADADINLMRLEGDDAIYELAVAGGALVVTVRQPSTQQLTSFETQFEVEADELFFARLEVFLDEGLLWFDVPEVSSDESEQTGYPGRVSSLFFGVDSGIGAAFVDNVVVSVR